MDKYEYRIRAEEINDLIEKREYVQAVKIADTIDWRRVRSVSMLCKVSELYKINRRYEDSKEVLLLAYELQPKSRKIVYSLCELSIKLEETVQAVEYYKEFIKVAPKDTGRFILQYRLYEAQDVSLEERIAVLEEYKKRDYREKWAYELAYLYHRIGLATRCIEECDELILWFGEGKYVIKALELKMLHAPLDPVQQEKYNARFMVPVPEEVAASEEEAEQVEPSLSIEIKSVDATKAKTAEIPNKKIQEEIEETTEPVYETYEQEIPASYEADTVRIYNGEELQAGIYEPVYEQETEGYETENYETAEPESESELMEEIPEDDDIKIVNPNEDLDIQVKTIDVGDEYNTINLQDELAKNLAEIFAKEDMEASDATRALPIDSIFQATSQNLGIYQPESESVEEETAEELPQEEPETEETEEIEEVIEEVTEEIPEEPVEEVAEELPQEEPETEEIEEIEEVTEEIAEELPQEEPETEEIEEIEEVIEEVTEEIPEEPVEEVAEELPQEEPEIEPIVFGQNQPLPDAFIQAVQSAAMEAVKQAAAEAAKQAAAEAAKQAAQQATAEVIKEMKPETPVPAAEEELSEETVAEEPEEQVEKQITGQLSFSDIMAEWEETKKANEEKHLQEMKQRVMEQTGPLLTDFDIAARASVQSDLDMLSPMIDVFSGSDDTEELATEVEDALKEEVSAAEEILAAAEEPMIAQESVTEETPAVMEESMTVEEPVMEETPVVIEEPTVEEAPVMIEESTAEEVPVTAEELTEKVAVENEVVEDRPSSFNTEEINGLEEKLMGALTSQHYETANIKVPPLENEISDRQEVKQPEEPVKEEPVTAGPRTLTKEEKDMFGSIAPTKELQEHIADVLDHASLLPYTGNIIITGEKGVGRLDTAKNIALYLSKTNRPFSDKIKVYSSEEFNGKDIFSIVNDLPNGTLIIQNAGDMSADLCNKLMKAGNEAEKGGILYILVDTKSGIERLTRGYAKITEYFNLNIDISVLDNNGLVNFGKEYAKEKEYSIDDMGVLALYNRIEERQTNEHAVTVDEVKQIIHEAIDKSEKKNISHFVDVIFAKRYDKDDMIVLREKDFIND